MDQSEEDEAFNHDALDVLIPGGFSKRVQCPSAIPMPFRTYTGEKSP